MKEYSMSKKMTRLVPIIALTIAGLWSAPGAIGTETDELLMVPMNDSRVESAGLGNIQSVGGASGARSKGEIALVVGEEPVKTPPRIGIAIPRSTPPVISAPTQPGIQQDSTIRIATEPTAARPVPNESGRIRPTAENRAENPSGKDEHVHIPLKCASFGGVTAGETTQKDLFARWGQPRKASQTDLGPAYLYSIEGFNHIEVQMYRDADSGIDVVLSVAITFEEPLPVGQVREGLADELQKAKPIMIAAEDGSVLGHVFPEKGVRLIFAPSEKPGVTSTMVTRLAIEPIIAEPFVLRAEGYLNDMPEDSREDLESALMLDPENARACWLLAQIELACGNPQEAWELATKAVALDEVQVQYQVFLAKILAQTNNIVRARGLLEELLPECEKYQNVYATALCQLGDSYQLGTNPDYIKASKYHQAAIEVSSKLLNNANPTTRLTAKETFLNAYLGATKDIALGTWANKETTIEKWLTQSKEFIKDPELTSRKPGTKDFPLRVALTELAVRGEVNKDKDIGPYVQNVLAESKELINLTPDNIQKMKYLWETGLALYNTARISQARGDYDSAIRYCGISVGLVDEAMKNRGESLQDAYLVSRIKFRLGAMHAIGKKDHEKAVEYYTAVRPRFEMIASKISPEELGSLGDTFITMGVSYWNTGQQEQALTISLQGTKFLEQAVAEKLLSESALVIPYKNISTMYQRLNQTQNAELYMGRSERIRTAAQPAGPVR